MADTNALTITGERRRVNRDSLSELWHYRGVLWAFAIRTVKVKYKQAFVGIGWSILQPVIAALIFAVFFGRLNHLQSEGVPYLVFALAGMVSWTFFSATASAAMSSLVDNAVLLRKIYFPREILPLSSILAGI